MANCPACGAEIHHVIAEKIELSGVDDIVEETNQREGYAVASLCPECDSILGI